MQSQMEPSYAVPDGAVLCNHVEGRGLSTPRMSRFQLEAVPWERCLHLVSVSDGVVIL